MNKPKRIITRSEALISDCGLYRYWLLREWDSTKPQMRFIMLNPSTADWRKDDPTIRKCMGFAELAGAGSILVMNLFALRSTQPTGLLEHEDPVGPENDSWLHSLTTSDASLVCAWGDPSHMRVKRMAIARMPIVRTLLGERPLLCLNRTASNMPSHPLMLAYSFQPTQYTW